MAEPQLVSSSLGNHNGPLSPPTSATVTEPTFIGRIESVEDAVRVIDVSQRALLPMIPRNLDFGDLSVIRSGSVFV
jgi:hypothetical protein